MTRPRAPNAAPETRFFYGTMALEALRMAPMLAAGLALSPGERESLDRMPEAVRAAVLTAWNPNSRYIPQSMRRLKAAAAANRAQFLEAVAEAQQRGAPQPKRQPIPPEAWSPALARWQTDTEGKDQPGREGRPSRIVTICPPAQVRGATARILSAIAREAGTKPATIRAWADEQRDALDQADAPDLTATLREAGHTESAPMRKPDQRRRPKGERRA